MNFVFFSLSIIISLFVLYILTKSDFVFLRKNITLHNMFDTLFLSFIGFFLFARILYVFAGLRKELYSFIPFLHMLRYPGSLYLGGILGFALVVYLRFRKKKILLHILDVYSLSLYPFFLFILLSSELSGNFLFFNLFILLLSLLFFGIGIYSYKNITLKDGTISLLFLCLICVFTIINEFSTGTRVVFSFTIPQVIAGILFLTSSAFILIHESFIPLKK